MTHVYDTTSGDTPDATHGSPPNPQVGLADLLTWVGEDKRLIAVITATAMAASVAVAVMLPAVYTARTALLPPGSQQQTGSSAAMAALGSLGGLAGGLGVKTPDELYVALLRSDSVVRALDERFQLKARYKVTTNEALRKTLPKFVRVTSDKKSGVINVEVDDEDPSLAADLANAHAGEVAKVLSRLAVSEAQQRRLFFETQVTDIKNKLVQAEIALRRLQEQSGVIAVDRQAEALVSGAAQVRALIAARDVQLKVLRTGATEQNPDVQRLNSELLALRGELARMESSKGGKAGSATDMPVGKIPETAIDFVRARRELKLQETLLEAMVRQLELARLDEAREGPLLQQIDVAIAPDYKSKPSRAMIIITGTLLALLASLAWVLISRFVRLTQAAQSPQPDTWSAVRRAWRWRAPEGR